MAQLRYIEEAVSLAYDESLCNGCGLCVAVCPRAVFSMEDDAPCWSTAAPASSAGRAPSTASPEP